ncbi:MAG: extracellular solute-binding protein [Candidatus Promineofilum sp.]|nr:extracellular solute-binding protein [Promineifilum sp.]
MKPIGRLLPLLLPILLLLAACDLLSETPLSGSATPTTPVAPTATVALAIATSPPSPSPVAPLSPVRVWLPAEIAARTAGGAQEFADQIRAFETTRPELAVVVEQKPVEGAGGILSYLRTGATVAPSILPDVIALPTGAIADPAVRQLVQPLDGLFDPVETYPDAAAQIVADDRLFGVPFVSAGLTHMVYVPSPETDAIPMEWTAFISDTNHTLVLPADSRDGALFGLQFYLAEGGTLVNEAGQPDLQPEPLARALRQIAVRPENLLQSRQLKTQDEAWQYYRVGLSGFLWLRSEFYLGRRAELDAAAATPELAYSRVPGPAGALTPLTTTWAWAITTADPARQALARELIQALTMPENLAAFAERSQLLPAQREAMAVLAEGSDYFHFANGELERARAMPVSESSRQLAVIGDAVFQVLTTDASPEAIAEQAVLSLRQ